jgi:hypothetical protein
MKTNHLRETSKKFRAVKVRAFFIQEDVYFGHPVNTIKFYPIEEHIETKLSQESTIQHEALEEEYNRGLHKEDTLVPPTYNENTISTRFENFKSLRPMVTLKAPSLGVVRPSANESSVMNESAVFSITSEVESVGKR